MDLYEYDRGLSVAQLCGVDEAGRGPLAGDVYAAAVILPPDCVIEGLNDSKKLTEKKREALFEQIVEQAVAYHIATATVEEIDALNILNATFLAMKRAVEGLSQVPELALIDGNKLPPDLPCPAQYLVKGDGTSASVAAASILAKVARDRYMKALEREYPQYGFAKNKGYGSQLHYRGLLEYGESPVHRKTFLKKMYDPKQMNAHVAGALGEKTAKDLLKHRGYEIAAQNYHSRYGEVDLIARKGDVLAFVEVKTRKDGAMASALEAVSKSKQEKIVKTALLYLTEIGADLQPRFDVIEVVMKDGKAKTVNHLEAAFTADGLELGI